MRVEHQSRNQLPGSAHEKQPIAEGAAPLQLVGLVADFMDLMLLYFPQTEEQRD